MTWGPTRWQRVVLLLAAAFSLWHAWGRYADDQAIGLSFVVGILALIGGIAPPLQGEPWLPHLPLWLVERWKSALVIMFILLAAGTLVVWQKNVAELARFQKEQVRQAEARKAQQATDLSNKALIETKHQKCIAKVGPQPTSRPSKGSVDYSIDAYMRTSCDQARDEDLRKLRAGNIYDF